MLCWNFGNILWWFFSTRENPRGPSALRHLPVKKPQVGTSLVKFKNRVKLRIFNRVTIIKLQITKFCSLQNMLENQLVLSSGFILCKWCHLHNSVSTFFLFVICCSYWLESQLKTTENDKCSFSVVWDVIFRVLLYYITAEHVYMCLGVEKSQLIIS